MLTLITKQKKIRIELEDAEGGKYNLSLEGSMSRDKMVKACELMELLELRGQTINNNINNNNNTAPQARTKYKFSKIRTWPLWVPRRGG
ncbi:MAG: hypothetical protein WBL88_02340 [Nitrososphaeraceae archaeon]